MGKNKNTEFLIDDDFIFDGIQTGPPLPTKIVLKETHQISPITFLDITNIKDLNCLNVIPEQQRNFAIIEKEPSPAIIKNSQNTLILKDNTISIFTKTLKENTYPTVKFKENETFHQFLKKAKEEVSKFNKNYIIIFPIDNRLLYSIGKAKALRKYLRDFSFKICTIYNWHTPYEIDDKEVEYMLPGGGAPPHPPNDHTIESPYGILSGAYHGSSESPSPHPPDEITNKEVKAYLNLIRYTYYYWAALCVGASFIIIPPLENNSPEPYHLTLPLNISEIALRETSLINYFEPFAGSYYIENMANKILQISP